MSLPSSTGGSDGNVPTPTPVPGSDDNKQGGEPQTKKRRGKEKGEVLAPLTPIERAKDLAARCLDSKKFCDTNKTVLKSLPFGQQLVGELTSFSDKFELLGLDLHEFQFGCNHIYNC